MGALLGEPGGRAPLQGTLKQRLNKLWKRVYFKLGPFWGNMKWCSFLRDFERRVRFFFDQNLYWGIRETHKGMLWKWASLFIGAPLGNREGWGLFYQGL